MPLSHTNQIQALIKFRDSRWALIYFTIWRRTGKLLVTSFCYYIFHLFSDCNVVSKRDWDGLTPIHVEYLPRPVSLVIIQHTVTGTCSTDAKCAEVVRNIQTYHMDNLNYWDIGSS